MPGEHETRLPSSGDRHSDPASRLDDFRIVRLIGRGGMGSVYEAYQESMHRSVALKVLDLGVLASEIEQTRFEREAWIGGRLSHPHIVKVFGHGVSDGRRYIAMELVDGGSLHAEIQRRKQPPTSTPSSHGQSDLIRRIVAQFVPIADALRVVHEAGIVHRDIKPLNLLLGPDGRLLLSDFGLARDESSSKLTRQGDVMGTLPYMSPEQLQASPAIDHRTDIWSLGVSLYEAIVLELPYAAPSAEAYVASLAAKDPVSPRARNRAVPRDLETILLKCLQRDPSARYATAAELRDDLRRLLEDRPVHARRAGAVVKTARWAKRNRVTVSAVTLIGALALGTLLVSLARQRREGEHEQIRMILQQAIDDPELVLARQPGWQTLRLRLNQNVAGDPNTVLARLSRRAACRVTAAMPAFGLLSDAPKLQVRYFTEQVTDDLSFRCTVELEARWNEGSWRVINSAVLGNSREFRGFVISPRLSEIVHDTLSPGPQRLSVRARVRTFQRHEAIAGNDRVRTSPEDLTGTTRPEHEETRMLGSYPITLFERYPNDFPREVPAATAGTTTDSFRLSRMALIRADLPPTGTRPACVEFHAPRSNGVYAVCQDAGRARMDGAIVAIGFTGTISSLQVPIAATGILQVDNSIPPFPISFSLTADDHGVSVNGTLATGPDEDAQTFYHVLREPMVNPGSLVDAVLHGQVRLTPSRDIARGAAAFDRFFGGTLVFDVPVEITTVTGSLRDK